MGFVHTTLKTVGDTVVISVEDNGIGIPDEDMEHVFERFYRVDKNRSRAVGGTGLGLSIVSDTVRRRGGSIRAQHRQSGSGTVFIVDLLVMAVCASGIQSAISRLTASETALCYNKNFRC